LLVIFLSALVFYFVDTRKIKKAEILYKKSIDAFNNGDLKKSEIYLGSAIKNHPKAEYFYSAYYLLLNLGRPSEAEIYKKSFRKGAQ